MAGGDRCVLDVWQALREGDLVHTYEALPGRVVFGAGVARTELAAEIDRIGAKAVLLVASTRDAERVRALAAPLGDRVAGTFTDVREHVPVETARAARAAAADADAVLAIGGGSTIGAAKAVALTTRLPVLAVPTTYAGSEVTPVWGMSEDGVKTTGVDPAVLPRTVVYDPELTVSLPADLAVASALNAMAHAVEAFWAPRRNPVSSVLAEEAVRSLGAGLAGTGLGAATDLLRGAWLAGTAFAVTGSGLHHKLAHVLGGIGLPHARTHAVLLPHVLAFTAPGAPEAVERIGRALGTGDAVAGVRDLVARAGVPGGLRALGLREEQLATVADRTAAVVPVDHPVPVAVDDLSRLVRTAWEGA